ncbi:MAG: PAS domain-containing sensor histidine kinase [Campylobacterota bacterium]|nr:PAS domain-containing sensor histidine kinase [Campylobacterota bacterium]
MKKNFIFIFIILWGIVSIYFYKNYTNIKEQNKLISDKELLYKFDLAQELLYSKLKNIYYQDFNQFTIKKIISQNNKNSMEPLKTIVETKFHQHKDFLKDIIFYNNKGEVLFSTNKSKEEKNLNIQKLNINKIDIFKLQFEYFDNESKVFSSIEPIIFQGSTVGYIKQIITLKKFMELFFDNKSYVFLKSNKNLSAEDSYLYIKSINPNKLFIVKIIYENKIDTYLIKELILQIIFSFILLGIINYILYTKFKKEESLKEKISQQKEFFEMIIEASPNPIFLKDSQKRYLLANKSTTNMFNLYNHSNIMNKTNNEICKNKNYLKYLENDESHTLNNKQIVYRQVLKVEDKYYKFTFIYIDDIKYPKKEPMILGFATDITREIKRKNELNTHNTKLKMEIFDEMSNRMKINEKFKKIFDNIDDAMFTSTICKDGQLSAFMDINTAGIKFLQHINDNNGLNPNEIFKGFKFNYSEKNNTFEVSNNSYIDTISKDKETYNTKVSCHIVLIKNNHHAIIFVQNIDEIIKLKKEKKEQRVLIANIFKKASTGIAVINKDAKFIKYNQSFYKTLGFRSSDFKEKDFYSLFTKDDLEEIKIEHNLIFQNKKPISKEYNFTTNDKTIINVIASSTLIKDENENLVRLFIFENITKQKQLELEQQQNNKIIAQQAKMAEMGEMIGAIAHQWRQPLNAINAAAIKLNFSSSLNILKNEEVQEKTKFIENQSIKMSETINDFMNFFKPSRNKEIFLVNNIYKKIFDFLEPQLKNRDIVLSLETNYELELFGFQNEFEHILLNIINNAKDAFDSSTNNENKTIKVYLEADEDKNIVRVIDNAGGIPQSILNKIFNPYFTTKEEGKGTGIGLYMTKTIIEKHFKGKIKVNNNEDGAVFTIFMPKELND